MHRSQAGLMAILEAAVDGIVVINERGIIESVNPAVTKLFGYTPDRLLGQNVKMLMPDPYHTEHDQYLRNYLTSGLKKVIGIGREVLLQHGQINHVAERFGHLAPARQPHAVSENGLRRFESGGQQKGRPVHGVEAQNVFAD